jgi:hypothetical protein
MPFKNLLLIGCGLHARAFYFPTLKKLQTETGLRISAVVDLRSNQHAVSLFLSEKYSDCVPYYVESSGERLSGETVALLNRIVTENKIEGVIVSTDPLNHKSYSLWALSNNLHLLLDKPITTRVDAVLDIKQANAIETDYQELFSAYQEALKIKETSFIVCAHRRYHPGLNTALQLIGEIAEKTGCPVTNIHSYHCDGQWRLPGEMVTQTHHSYFDGHGKVSHSGYHFIDSLYRFRTAGMKSGKSADSIDIFSSFIRPRGLLKQLKREDYEKIFGKEYNTVNPFSDSELAVKFERFGEIDAEINFTFYCNNEPVGLATLSLLHNGYSRRSWVRPGTDLYKGNGRVKHEQHRIHLGPFLCVQIHSYQSKDKHDDCDSSDLELGGNNHFEMFIFRNTAIIDGKPVERYSLADLATKNSFADNELHIHRIKEGAVREFAQFINGQINRQQLQSDIADHSIPVRLMSAIYRSWVQRQSGENPVVRIPLTNE